MDNNVKIVLGNGNVLDAVGISYIHIEATNKDYIFYSLNELANGNMDKIYIAEAAQNGTTPGPISDDEWINIKQIMLSISHSEPVNGISYKPLVGMTINVGDAKKLAIKGDKKQAFIDAQNKAIAPTTQIDEPAFVSEQAANGSPFYASDVSATGQVATNTVPEETVQSAFAMQPPVQQDVPTESLEETPSVPDISTTVVEATPQPEQVLDTAVSAIEPISMDNEQVVETVEPTIPQQNAVEIEDGPAIPVVENVSNNQIDNTNINVEELKQAVIDAQNAIDKINAYLNSLNNPVKTVVVDTVHTQTVATGVSPVSTESMVVANQPEIKTDSLTEETQLINPNENIVPTAIIDSTNQVNQTIVEPEQPIANQSALINTTVPMNEVIDTSVQSVIDTSVVPVSIEPLEAMNNQNEVPAFTVDDNLEQPQTLDLNNVVTPQSTPNSAADINNSSVIVNIPEAPVVENITPVIPITPNEANGIPTAQIIPTIEPVPQNNVVTPTSVPEQQTIQTVEQPVQQIQPISNVVEVQPVVQGVPEINVAPVQQVPILDLSAINTNVTLPTDMTSNPNPGTISEGVLGPATLDVNDQAA